MKRSAVLFGILILAVCGSSYATAPQVRDMPDVRLQSGISGASGLPSVLMDAYDVFDYVKDVDQCTATVSILDVQMIAGPTAGSPAVGSTAVVNIDGSATVVGATSALVDLYGRSSAGWQQYTVQVDDGTSAVSDPAIVKYATFALNAPTIESGVFLKSGGEDAESRQFVYCWVGPSSGELYRLDVAVTPEDVTDTLDWYISVHDVIYDTTEVFDANGTWKGLLLPCMADGAAINYEGLYYEIDTEGRIRLTSGGNVSPGPWIIDILAVNQSDANESDGSRIMVANAMLAEASPDTATVGASVTFNDLTPATIAAAPDRFVITTENASKGNAGFMDTALPPYEANIATGCAWNYSMAADDTVLDSVPLEIVDLTTDMDLPAEAKIWASTAEEDPKTAHIAGGNAIKAVMGAPPVGNVGPRGVDPVRDQLPGFRLVSRAFTGIQSTDIITFAVSVASDVLQATDLPKYKMYCGSGYSGALVGKDIRVIGGMLGLIDGAGYTKPQIDFPLASQGWHTLSITYGVGASPMWLNVNGDTAFDQDDLDILSDSTMAEGWDGGDELSAVKCGIQVSVQKPAVNGCTVWLDNMRVFRSAYALDLALGNEQIVTGVQSGESSAIDDMVAQNVMEFTTGDIDGTMESATGVSAPELSAIGFYVSGDGSTTGNAPSFKHPEQDFVIGGADLAIGAYDHTKDAWLDGSTCNASSQSLKITLPASTADGGVGDPDGADGWSGALDAVRQAVNTATVAGSGDGLYAVEAFVAKMGPSNSVNTYRDPGVRVLIQEMAPNYIGTAAGYIMTNGGLANSVTDAAPYNWFRAVADLYIPNCDYLRGLIQVLDTFKADVGNFRVPVYVDDLALYKVDDPAVFFDADLYLDCDDVF